ncbi:MAG: hypothetical protein KBC12_00675 [Candidatus Pacebacteria bacterium]|jgi:hypothetical protein|nr:hypothetical protein [Candidatus Paceibacterota bacterium]MBP9851162.1 hypothetical protein [Candidatus Paceibacterota bacterium]
MKKFFWAISIFLIIFAPTAPLQAQVSDSLIISIFEMATEKQPLISQMEGDTIVVDSLPFFWKVSVQKACFVYSKGGNRLAVNKTAWYSVSVPNTVCILWNARRSEGTIYTRGYNYEIEKIDNKFKVVAVFKKN